MLEAAKYHTAGHFMNGLIIVALYCRNISIIYVRIFFYIFPSMRFMC